MSKALQALLDRRRLMIAAGASAANIAIIDARIADTTPKSKVHVPTVAAVVTTDSITTLDTEIAALRSTITAAEQRLAEAEHERRSLKLTASAAKINAEFNAEFGEDDTEPLISDDLVRDVLARAEQKAAETTAPDVIEGEDENYMDDTAVEVSGEVYAVTRQPVFPENPFAKFLEELEAEETAAFVTDHGTVYTPTPEQSFAETFAAYEPQHVAAVAAGAEARFVMAPDRRWLVAARADQIDSDTGEVVVRRADGTTTVPILGDVIARCGSVAVYGVAA